MTTEVKAQNTTTLASVKAIYDAADQANTLLDGMQAAATAAGITLNDIYQDAADAQTAADTAQNAADGAVAGLSTVENVVGVLNWITAHGTMTLTSDVTVNPAHVYFVVDAGGDYVVGGTHYSIVSEPKDAELSTYYELTVDESVQNYVATHVAVDTEGLWLIPENNATPASSGKKILIATGAGSTYMTAGTYIIEKVGGVDTVLASFTASGAQIGQDASGNYVVIDDNSFDVYHENTRMAHFGYISGSNSYPYYTIGTRLAGSAVASYSVAEGINTTASGIHSHAEGTGSTASGSSSHAEGYSTTASGHYSHAEGYSTTASGHYSHAEGQYSTASGNDSHAEGFNSTAGGLNSHAQNLATKASGNSQTALGKYNIEDNADTYAVIVGNGTDYNSRSNALTVDWSGNVEAAGDVTDGAGNVLSNKRQSAFVQMYHGNRALNNTASKITGLSISAGGNYSDYFDVGTADQVTIKKTGGYRIDMAMRFSAVTNAANVKRISLYRNGSEFVVLMSRASSWEDFSTFYTQDFSVGDVLTMYGRSEDGNATASIERIYIEPIS